MRRMEEEDKYASGRDVGAYYVGCRGKYRGIISKRIE